MSLLARLICATVLQHAFLALSALLAVFAVLLAGEELRDAGKGTYDLAAALRFVALSLPAEACRLVPAAALLGAVIGLGRLADANQLTAIFAAGVAPRRVTLWTLLAGSLFAALAWIFGEWVASPLSCRAQVDRAIARSNGQTLSTAAGVWTRDGARFMHAAVVEPDGALGEVSVFELRGLELERYTRARRGQYTDGAWHAEGAVQTRLGSGGGEQAPAAADLLGALPKPDEIRKLAIQPEDLSLAELRSNIEMQVRHGENPFRYQVAFWQRAGLPIVTIVMVLAALPFVLTRSQRFSSGTRTLAAVLVGMGLQMGSDTFHQFGLAYSLPPPVIAFFPILAVLVLTPVLFRALRPV